MADIFKHFRGSAASIFKVEEYVGREINSVMYKGVEGLGPAANQWKRSYTQSFPLFPLSMTKFPLVD
jgi:hypothetical protein